MIRIIKIGDIKLDNPLFLLESFEVKNVKAVSFNTLGGSKIVYESVKRDNANNITLESMQNGWQKLETVNKIVELADDLNVTATLYTQSGGSINARFRIEESGVIKAEMIYEGSEWYRVTIKMAYV